MLHINKLTYLWNSFSLFTYYCLKPILCLPIIIEKIHYCVTYWLNRYFVNSSMIFMCLKNAPVSNFISPFCTLSVHPIMISVFRFGLSCPIIDCHHNLTIIESIICKCFKYIYINKINLFYIKKHWFYFVVQCMSQWMFPFTHVNVSRQAN